MRMTCGRDLEFRAAHERMIELAGRAHRGIGNRAVVRGDEIHQAEAQRFDARERGQLEGFRERAMRLDEQMAGNGPLDAELAARRLDEGDHLGGIENAADLGQHDEGGRFLRLAQDDAHVVAPRAVIPRAVIEVVDAHAHASEAIVLAAHERRHHFGVPGLVTDLRAVLAIQRDIEHRAQFGLQRQ